MVFTWNIDGCVIDLDECRDGKEIVVSCKDTESEEDNEEVDDEPEPDEDVILNSDEEATAPDSYTSFVIITPGDMIRWENHYARDVASHIDSLEEENDDGNGLRCISCELTFSLVARHAQHMCDGPPALWGLLNKASKTPLLASSVKFDFFTTWLSDSMLTGENSMNFERGGKYS